VSWIYVDIVVSVLNKGHTFLQSLNLYKVDFLPIGSGNNLQREYNKLMNQRSIIMTLIKREDNRMDWFVMIKIFLSICLIGSIPLNTGYSAESKVLSCKQIINNGEKPEVQRYLVEWVDEFWRNGDFNPRRVRPSLGILPGRNRIRKNVDWSKVGIYSYVSEPKLVNPLGEDPLGSGKIVERYDLAQAVFFSNVSGMGYYIKLKNDSTFSGIREEHFTKINDRVFALCMKRE